MKLNARWIGLSQPMGDVCPQFETRFTLTKDVQSATLRVTAMGVVAFGSGESVPSTVYAEE